MTNFVIEQISIDQVDALNTANHWDEGKPSDYSDVLEETKTSNWIDQFHDYELLIIDGKHIRWLSEAFEIGTVSGCFPGLFKEELDELLEEYINQREFSQGCFVRTEYTSLKAGCHNTGPYYSLKEVIESLVTTSCSHRAFYPEDDCIKIYLMEWKDIDTDKEFRLFVYNDKITAISQQKIYRVNEWLKNKTIEEHQKLLEEIIDWFDSITVPLRYCVIDMVFIDDLPHFIEINCFGKEYASGSALFHWIDDYNKLYGSEVVNYRFVSQ